MTVAAYCGRKARNQLNNQTFLVGIPVGDPKTEPQIFFFDVVCQANTLFHLFEKQFMDSAVPLIM